MKKRNIKILVIIAAVTIGCGYIVYRLRFPCTGSRSGQVIHAVTGQPIQGAVVYYTWKFVGSPWFYHKPVAGVYETTTDKAGRYFIPSQRFKRKFLFGPLKSEAVLIYKNNYAVYRRAGEYGGPRLGRSFGYPGKGQKYRKKNNLVKLYPWKEGQSHDQHISLIDALTGGTGELLQKELEEERERAREERLAERREKSLSIRGQK